MREAADSVVPVHLELGGKGSNIVFEDADVEGALDSVVDTFQNSGQICYAPTLVDGVADDAAIACDEVFGPVFTLHEFETAGECRGEGLIVAGPLRRPMTRRVVVGMTGATGQVYGRKALELLGDTDAEVHLVLSDSSKINIGQETDWSVENVTGLADRVHSNDNIGAPPASGSFETSGLLVTPCSMKTLADIATGSAGNLITRSADVCLKERRALVVMPREKPLNRIHLRNMLAVTDAGGVVYPPMPSFYSRPDTVDEMVTRTMARALSYLDVDVDFEAYTGLG